MMEDIKLYNSHIEIGTRVLIILEHVPRPLDLEELNIYDFISLHSELLDESIKNLHPSNPSYGLELMSKERLLSESIHMLVHKGLVSVEIEEDNLKYYSNEFTTHFLSFLESNYYEELVKKIKNIACSLSKKTKKDLKHFIEKEIVNWNITL